MVKMKCLSNLYIVNNLNKIFFFVAFFMISFVVFNVNVFGVDTYADIEIDITDTGLVSISGTTNLEEFTNISNSHDFTSKKRQYWKFELVSNDVVGDYVYRINLPEGAVVNYINLDKNFRLEQNNNKISLIGLGENNTINVTVQYQIVSTKVGSFLSQFKMPYLILLVILLVLISFVGGGYYYVRNHKKGIVAKQKKIEDDEVKTEDIESNDDMFSNNLIYEKLSPRQKDILNLLKERELLNLKEIEELMQIPKSSISRNVKSLELYDLIVKQRIGKAVYIKLKKEE